MRAKLCKAVTSLPFILLLALCFRLLYFWSYRQHFSENALGTIPFLFEPGNIAFSIVNGHGFSSPLRVDSGPTAWMTPVYPVVLAAIFRLFGTYTFSSFVAAAGLNILFSTSTCVPIYYAARRMGGLAWAGAASFLWAIFPNALVLPVESIWDASLAALLAASLLWATLAVADSQRFSAWCGYGLLWGASILTTASLATLLPLQFGWIVYRIRNTGSHHMKMPACAAAIALACCLPWTIRNYLVLHAFVPLRSVMGLSLWMGNNEKSIGRWPGWLHPIDNSTERERFLQLGEIAYMREKREEAVHFMESRPSIALTQAGTRFVAFWSGGTASPVSYFRHSKSYWLRTVLVFNVFAALAMVAGIIVLLIERNAYTFPLATIPIFFPWPYYLTLANPRYRHPIDGCILLLAAIAIVRGARWVRTKVCAAPHPLHKDVNEPV
jgi:hypothetical protein